MEPPAVQFVGAPCGQHGPYTFYKAFKYTIAKKKKILALGEFFFIKTSKDAPVCIGEMQLIWQDKNNKQLLGSVRLYFLPEHTPEGRLEYHGEDEVLAESEKFVIKLEDLVDWIIEYVDWPIGQQAFTRDELTEEKCAKYKDLAKAFAANNGGLQLKDIDKEKKVIGDKGSASTPVRILSYSQYCRYRAVLKRLENVENHWLRAAVVCAMGGVTMDKAGSRILFCKDTFDHPELQFHDYRQDHLAPNLKGRPRKRKLSLKKDGESDSDESDKSTYRASHDLETKPKENRRRKPQPRSGTEPEEKDFLKSLYAFMRDRNTPIERIPSLGFKQIDLWNFWNIAHKLGGYDKVTQKRMWKNIYDQLGGNPANTSAATCTRRHYEKLLLPYEKYRAGEENGITPSGAKKKKRKGRAKGKPAKLSDKENNTENISMSPDKEKSIKEESNDVLKVENSTKLEKPSSDNKESTKLHVKAVMKTETPQTDVTSAPVDIKNVTSTIATVPAPGSLPPRPSLGSAHHAGMPPRVQGPVLDTVKRKGPSIMSPLMNKRMPIKKSPQAPHEYASYLPSHPSHNQQLPPETASITNNYARNTCTVTDAGMKRPSVIQMATKSSTISQPRPAHTNKTAFHTPPISPSHKRPYPYSDPYYPHPSGPHVFKPPPAHKEGSDGPYHEAAKRHRILPGTSGGSILNLHKPQGYDMSGAPNYMRHSQLPPKADSGGCDLPQDLSMKQSSSTEGSHSIDHFNPDEPINLSKKSTTPDKGAEVKTSVALSPAPAAHQKPLPAHPLRIMGASPLSSPTGMVTPPAAHQRHQSVASFSSPPRYGASQRSLPAAGSSRAPHPRPAFSSPVSRPKPAMSQLAATITHSQPYSQPQSRSRLTSSLHSSRPVPGLLTVNPPAGHLQSPSMSSKPGPRQPFQTEVSRSLPSSSYMHHRQLSTHSPKVPAMGTIADKEGRVHPAFPQTPFPSAHSPVVPTYIHPYSTHIQAHIQPTVHHMSAYTDYLKHNGIAGASPYLMPTTQPYSTVYPSPSSKPREAT